MAQSLVNVPYGLIDHPGVDKSILHGNLLYESEVHVPLILYNPSDARHIPRGRRVKDRVRLLDLMPTILDYVEVPEPDQIHSRPKEAEERIRRRPLRCRLMIL